MRQQSLVESFNAAIEGFVYVFKSQRSMRLHFLMGLFAALLGVLLNFNYMELIMLCLTIAFVLFAEMFNTAIEYTVDLVSQEYHPLARIVKDIGAGAVLLSAITSIVVGYILFASRAGIRIEDNIMKIRTSSWNITFIVLIFILSIVILSKLLLHRGTPLRGGMPSGHAAIAFSIWAIISLLYPNSLVIFLVFILAILVARSRLSSGIHSIIEVFIGAILGISVTVFIFQFLRI
ncbi:MAG: diacylglycerol kinase [Candidatus Omnitrophica bacterium CG22_combo_CG10-13_8_21_14_all_43_16]|nr:MAG: diacylglycerol kinase [Candidatus Omnitrophica bacterium CG22_combo_CG10-13_8_21_14_all_43_16]